MSDIVERLRSEGGPLSMEAAARMEKLEFALARGLNEALKSSVHSSQRIHNLVVALEMIGFQSNDDIAIRIARKALEQDCPPKETI